MPGAGMAQGGIAGFAARAPSSKAGTLFGIPLSSLRDQKLEQKVLLVCGILILGGLALPYLTKPKLIFAFSSGMPKFKMLILPLLAGICYLAVALQPQAVREKIPPIVLQWVPFGVSLAAVGIIGFVAIPGGGGGSGIVQWGYPVLVFGLLASLSRPDDAVARSIILAGAGLLLVGWIDALDMAFKFKAGPGAPTWIFFGLYNLFNFLVLTLAVATSAFSLAKWVPNLKPLEAFMPLCTAILLVWLPVQAILMMLIMMIHLKMGAAGFLFGAHGLINIVAFFGVLMMTAPEAYDRVMEMFAGHQQQVQQGGAYPPPQGMQPPPPGMQPPPPGMPPQQPPPPGGQWPPQQ